MALKKEAERPQYTKFSGVTIAAKRNLRQLRLNAGYTMNEGSRLLGVSRKQLEDIETERNYGCHLDLEILAKVIIIYKTSLDDLVGSLPDDQFSSYLDRKGKTKS